MILLSLGLTPSREIMCPKNSSSSWKKQHLVFFNRKLRYSPDVMSHSLASARKQPLEVVRFNALFILSVHLLYFESGA